MRRAVTFAFVVLLVGQVTIIGAQFELASQFNRVFQLDKLEIAPELNLESDEFIHRANEALQTLFPQNILKRLSDVNLNDSTRANATTCFEQVERLKNEFKIGATWALKMLDASSKLTSGILIGNQVDLGMYDECIAIKVSDAAGEDIRGRHCMYSIGVKMENIELLETLSICLPAVCEPEDIQIILNQTIKMVKPSIDLEIPVTIANVTCSSVGTPEWTAGGIATLVGFSMLLLFLVVSTICDALLRCSKGYFSRDSRLATISKFSVYSSALRILSTKTTPQTLPALQGLRFFSMCWVVLGHEFFMVLFSPTINRADFFTWVSSWDSIYIMIAPFAVDTFFTISGFLLSYIFLKEMSTGRRFNLFGYYIHRYLRLTPALIAMLLITIFIFPRIGSGALWEKTITSASHSCTNNWWQMLLYVHNYVNKKDLGCLSHTWYLAAEMQLFVISPLILYPLSKKPKIGLTILGLFFIAAVATPAKISYDNKYSSALWAMKDPMKTMDTVTHFYMETHIRAAAWLMGILFGYLVFMQKGSMPKMIKWIGWLLATASFCFCIFSFRTFQDINYKYEPVWETCYAAFSRPIWSFGVAWVIYAAVRGFGGPVTTILSLSIFNPFSRISYCVYLVHYMILLMKVGSLRVPCYFTDFSMFNSFLSDFALSVVFGFLCSLLFESPVLILEKIVSKPRRGRKEELRKGLKDEKVENGIDNPALTPN